MKTYKIAVLGGDGTGPEVIREGVKVLKVLTGKKPDSNVNSKNSTGGGDRYNENR